MPALGGTTALLLLCVFTVVNVAVLVLRRDTVEHKHFRTPTFLPVLGALCCAFLAGPWTGRDPVQYKIAGVLLGIGVVLWVRDGAGQPRDRTEAGGTRDGGYRRPGPAQLIAICTPPISGFALKRPAWRSRPCRSTSCRFRSPAWGRLKK